MSTQAWLHRTEVERQERRLTADEQAEYDRTELLKLEAFRRFYQRLLEETGVLDKTLEHSTATVQAGRVALRDFGMQHLLEPLLRPEHRQRFVQMQEEADAREKA